MNYLIIDLETTSKGKSLSPRFNRIVAFSCKNTEQITKYIDSDLDIAELLEWIYRADVIIGHNIKFDLSYLWNQKTLQEWFKQGGQVWDTMQAEYILTGQEHKFAALRDIAVNKYGCKEREKVMEKYWSEGKCTSEIPRDLVLYDVENDVKDTERVFLQQYENAKNLGIINLILGQGDAICAALEMEINGMAIDTAILQKNSTELNNKIENIIKEINNDLKEYKLWSIPVEFNPNSTLHISALFFGGVIKTKEKIEIGIIKTGSNKGNIKYKNEDISFTIDGFKLKPPFNTKRDGVFQTNEKVLMIFSKQNKSLVVKNVADKLLMLRELKKQYSTYFESMYDLLDENDIVHPDFKQVSTDTGRWSCSNPNVQNQPKPPSKAMEHFKSRFANGSIIVADYKQIEIVVQAEITKDTQLAEDIKNGIDFHCKRTAIKHHKSYENVLDLIKNKKDSYWINQRLKSKAFSFQLSYGAGIKKIAEGTGMTLDEVKELIELENNLYPKVKEWKEQTKELVENIGSYRGITGRKWKFKKWPAPEWLQANGIMEAYKPQEVINYPIQGTAFDVASLMLGVFWRHKALYNKHKYLLINFIHDSVILDCKKEFINQAKLDLMILEDWKSYCKHNFKYDWQLDIHIDIKEGNNWYECA